MDIAQDIIAKNDTTTIEAQYAISLTLFNAVVNDVPPFVEYLLTCGGDIKQVQENIESIFSKSFPFFSSPIEWLEVEVTQALDR